MPERAHDRLSRLLGLVPYLTRRPGTDLADVAAHFDVAAEQIVDDLELLFVTGRPGHMPDDLIEAEWEGGRVYVGNADEVSVPVRLSPHEVGGLLLALDYLESAHEADPTTIRSVREKLQRASGENSGGMLDISPPRLPEELAETVRGALHGGTALDIRYYVPARDELTERTIRPLRLRLGRVWYLDAHCLTSGGDRSFAVDRIRAATPAPAPAAGSVADRHVDAPSAPAVAEVPDACASGAPQSAAAGRTGVCLTLRPESAWLADEIDAVAAGGTRHDDEHGAGTVSLELPRVGRAWAVRLLSAHGGGMLAADPQEVVRRAADVTHEALALYARRTPED
ncbi:WYL domain-containing protein [Brevibacterium jeotgali]|uniref:Proteasome accessory factor C n=1 Tax=Brevibacterium jeotgali TaxID=1262550 RepID=A0A2H1L241_9MICO|nr:WYL domain-containing protein [Brevibacterium jeotgali]TWC02828.1 proteasome accessory factor C [Brevibacterium jeotgali]SMY10850.1 proteasome accessory factor C [Brevibacterium jeotgali]